MTSALRKLLEDIAREFRSEPNIFYHAATRDNPRAVRRAKLVDRIERVLEKYKPQKEAEDSNQRPPTNFYVFELEEDGRTWVAAAGLHGGYATAREGLWAVMGSKPDSISRIFKVARAADAKAVHVFRRPIDR